MASLSSITTELAISRLEEIVGSPVKARRGKFFVADGNAFAIRTADHTKAWSNVTGSRLHWTKVPETQVMADWSARARDLGLPFDLVLCTPIDHELFIWPLPESICQRLSGYSHLYVHEEAGGRQVIGAEKNQRPLGSLDVRKFCFRFPLSADERRRLKRQEN